MLNIRTQDQTKSKSFNSYFFNEANKNINSDSALNKNYEGLPKDLDWRNRNGINFDSPIKKQGECGSCYAIASASIIEARIR